MGMIDRYKKSGGFFQLLKLIETCGPAKQEKLLNLVSDEAPNWGSAIKAKMLSMERILSWPEETLAEVFPNIQDLTLSTALHGFKEEDRERVFKFFSHAQRRRVEGIMSEKQPTDAEVSASYMKIIEEVRQLIRDSSMRLDAVDPSLVIEDDIEERLSKGAFWDMGASSADEPKPEGDEDVLYPSSVEKQAKQPSAHSGSSNDAALLLPLKRKVAALEQEKSELKEEIRLLRSKLEQIKKIA